MFDDQNPFKHPDSPIEKPVLDPSEGRGFHGVLWHVTSLVLLSLMLIPASSDLRSLCLITIGFAQLATVIPIGLFLKYKVKKSRTLQGFLKSVAVLFLLTFSCWGLVMSGFILWGW